jgi:hypothetical protein
LERLLDEVHPDLEELAATVAQLTGQHRPATPAAPERVPSADGDASPEADRSVPALVLTREPSALRPAKWGLIIAPLVIVGTLATAGAWWVLGAPSAADLAPPISAIPPVPRATAAWDLPIPITASLISLPSDDSR